MSVAFSIAPSVVHSQTDEQLSYQLGETNLFPAVRLAFEQNSNAFLTADNPTESSALIVSPELNWVADRRLLTLRGSYNGDYASSSESALNYADHEFRADVEAELTARKRVNGSFLVDFGHQTLGTNLTRGLADENSKAVQFINTALSGEFIYGAKNARGNITAGASIRSLAFTNRSDVTANSDYTRFRTYGIFSLRISPDTRALLELRLDNFNFSGTRASRTDTSLLAGFSFTPTGKFGGTVKLGTTLSSFSDGENDSTIISEADLYYEPTTFAKLTLNLDRQIDNESANPATADGVSVVRDRVALGWTHQWSARVSHDAQVFLENIDRACPSSDIETSGGSFEMNIKVRRWLTVGASATAASRSSSICSNAEATTDLDYEQQIIGAHIRATL